MAFARTQALFCGSLWWALALGLCLWIYWPGLAGPPLLDDAANLRSLQLLK